MALKASLGLLALLSCFLHTAAAAGDPQPAWKLRVVQVRKAAASLPKPSPPLGARLRVVHSLVVEAHPDPAEHSYVIHTRLINASSSPHTLRWDLARSPHLALPDGRVVTPIGHRMFGVSENALAVRGVSRSTSPRGRSTRSIPCFTSIACRRARSSSSTAWEARVSAFGRAVVPLGGQGCLRRIATPRKR